MNDWKEVVDKGPAYQGPSDSTLMHIISGFGSLRGCRYSELRKQTGEYHPGWKETLSDKINRMESDGKIIVSERLNDRYLEVVN